MTTEDAALDRETGREPGRELPLEFDPDHIKAHSAIDQRMYHQETHSLEPMQSVLENNPEIHFVPPMRGDKWGQWEFQKGAYYDTTTGDKHPFWKTEDLPQASKNIEFVND